MSLKKLFERQEIRFLFVGGLNTLVGYGVYALLLLLNINYLIANTISTIIGVLHSYLWNRFFTFKSKEKAGKEFLKFISVYIISYLIGTVSLYGFTGILNLSPYVAGLINLVITTLISWFGHKYFSFSNKKFSVKEFYRKNKKWIIALGIFCIYFILLLMYKNLQDFTDEGDVMLGAKMLSMGKLIYVDFPSQHLPFTYFIFAPFALLGVNSVLGFRVSMYFILALIWAGMFLRYYKTVGIFPLVLYPLLYITYMHVPEFTGATVISEHIQSQCLVILFLEIIRFYKNKKIDKIGKVLIPLNMVVAIGTAFVSIIPCVAVIAALFYLDIKFYYQKQKNLKKYLNHFFKKYKWLLIIGFGAVFLFIAYLYFTNSLEECWKQAFYLNTEIYSKYNGYSSNPIKTILFIVPNFLLRLPAYFPLSWDHILYLFLWIGVGGFFYKFIKKDILLTIILVGFILLCGNRAFEGMHAIPYYAVAIIGILLVCNDLSNKQKVIFLIIIGIIFIMQCGPFLKNIYKPHTSNEAYYEMIKQIDNNPYSLHIDINTSQYIRSNTLPDSRFPSMVPWFAEIYEEDYLKDIKASNAKILFYNPYGEVWGYRFKDYLPNVHKYILENYTYIYIYDFWIQKDHVSDAEKVVQADLAEYSNFYKRSTPFILQNNFVEQIIVPEENINKIALKVGTYNRENYSLIKIKIEENGETIHEETRSASTLKDNGYLYITEKLKKENKYKIYISSENTNSNDFIALYKNKDEENIDNNYLKINGIECQEDLAMEMYYE